MYRYANLQGRDVPKDKLQAANRAMIFCWSDLGIQNTYISWICAAGSAARETDMFNENRIIHGCVVDVADVIGSSDGFVQIRSDIPLRDVVRAVFHEARHIYQYKVCGGDPRGRGFDIEEDAWRYADEAEHASTTANIYAHAMRRPDEAAADKINDLFHTSIKSGES